MTTLAQGVVHSLGSIEIAQVACALDPDESVSEIASSNWWATVSGERASNCPQAVVVAISSTLRAGVIGASPDSGDDTAWTIDNRGQSVLAGPATTIPAARGQ
ncbi:MAG: hypothetical protein WCA82_12395 [Jiangellales bacterium]